MAFLGFGRNKKVVDSQDDVGSQEQEATPKASRKDRASKKKGKGRSVETLIERIQLDESVASSALSTLEEMVRFDGSAVREADDGFLIVAFTNDMLTASGVDPSSEDFGAFSQALRSESISSIALASDLEQGVIGLIPSVDTLVSLDEYDFIRDMSLQWAILPVDASDESHLILLDSTVSIARLLEIANDPDIRLIVSDNQVRDTVDYSDRDVPGQDENEDEPEVPEPYASSDNQAESFEPPYMGNEPDERFDDADEDAAWERNSQDGHFDNEYPDESYRYNSESDDMHEETDPEFDSSGDDLPLDTDVDDDEMAERAAAQVVQAAEHTFNNTELGLTVNLQTFRDFFETSTVVRFDERPTDQSELQRVISNIRRDANTEIGAFHAKTIEQLYQRYISEMRDAHLQIVTALDHTDVNQSNIYAKRQHQIDQTYNESLDDMDRSIAEASKQIVSDYEEAREFYGENAKREALSNYDTKHRAERDRKIAGVRDTLDNEIKMVRDRARGELYEDRRIVARRLMDKASTNMLGYLQTEYAEAMRKEMVMFDEFRKQIEAYLRKHFADDVLRAKAIAEQLKHGHEVEQVRRDYETLLQTKTVQLEEIDKNARAAIAQLENRHKEQIRQLEDAHARQLEQERQDKAHMKDLLQAASDGAAQTADRIRDETKSRMAQYQDQLTATQNQLEHERSRTKQSQRPMWFVLGGVAVGMLALGIILGVMLGVGAAQVAPQTPTQTQPIAPSAMSTTTGIEFVDRVWRVILGANAA